MGTHAIEGLFLYQQKCWNYLVCHIIFEHLCCSLVESKTVTEVRLNGSNTQPGTFSVSWHWQKMVRVFDFIEQKVLLVKHKLKNMRSSWAEGIMHSPSNTSIITFMCFWTDSPSFNLSEYSFLRRSTHLFFWSWLGNFFQITIRSSGSPRWYSNEGSSDKTVVARAWSSIMD